MTLKSSCATGEGFSPDDAFLGQPGAYSLRSTSTTTPVLRKRRGAIQRPPSNIDRAGIPEACIVHLILPARMTPRPMPDTLESLRVTLQTLEESAGPGDYSSHLAALKSFLLNRIAELEIDESLLPAIAEPAFAISPDESQQIRDGDREVGAVVSRRREKSE